MPTSCGLPILAPHIRLATLSPNDDHLSNYLDRLSTAKRPVVRLIVLATALACVTLLAFTAWFIQSLRETQLRQSETSTSNVARMVEAQVEAAMKTTDIALADLTERVRQDGTGAVALERLHRHMTDLVQTTPELHGLFVYGPDGTWLATSLREPVRGNNADRPYFHYHLTHPDNRKYIGAPIQSRSTGVWIIPVSRRINGPDGRFAGVALVTLKINFFERIYDELDIGSGGTVLLTLADGTIVYRRPFNEKLIGFNLSNGAIFRELRKQAIGSALLVAQVDDIERLYSFRRMQSYPFLVAVGRSKNDILSGWRHSSIMIGTAAFLVCAMFAGFGRKLIRQVVIRDRLDQLLRDLSEELQEHNLGLQQLAQTDKLTGIANRRRFDELLELELRRSQRTGMPVSLILLDLDYFKQFNDVYGHLAGDACLRDCAQALTTQVVRAGDVAARYGGEEFAVILSNTDEAGAVAVGERIRAAIEALGIAHRLAPARIVTASLGVATARLVSAGKSAASILIEQADRQLYEAKRRGRNQVCSDQMLLI